MSDGERVDMLMMGTRRTSGGSSGRNEREVHRVNHPPIPDSTIRRSLHSESPRQPSWSDFCVLHPTRPSFASSVVPIPSFRWKSRSCILSASTLGSMLRQSLF
ncbi:hypothetical protein PILCRDRAFT_830413 [Piloderma croceum F 1598]|uniref:Uncharacterized protein n=1 Tax=Piloderma croceum (strain F 1598) TaxID=765440 RepID=A0A0C3EF90_PILCF|nr:hypothetical protein PILCRDRAFT_830413 [Piloderma croceum F 1598]